ncbi:hypothetical protein RclHR1_12580004 [Rhizophagus clarus]|uniref:Uncharacterized protein n=1 Tax=Rhizophagus clarus TaxID=94130 RepID=A0A2Z6R0F4_9GLOM|nr:hypothetical protein RclHR1_12580004 [Rhizophagus clarus]
MQLSDIHELDLIRNRKVEVAKGLSRTHVEPDHDNDFVGEMLAKQESKKQERKKTRNIYSKSLEYPTSPSHIPEHKIPQSTWTIPKDAKSGKSVEDDNEVEGIEFQLTCLFMQVSHCIKDGR